VTRWQPPHPSKPPPPPCPHQPRYPSRTAARQHATRAALTGAINPGTPQPCDCGCGGWHLKETP
jgi:hypothetical protein